MYRQGDAAASRVPFSQHPFGKRALGPAGPSRAMLDVGNPMQNITAWAFPLENNIK